MKKRDFFIAAMQAEEFRRRAWVISAFSLIQEGPDDWKQDPYAYRIVQNPTGYFFVDPANENQLSPIEDGKAGEPLYSALEKLTFQAGEVLNAKQAQETTYGRLLFNFVALIYPFGRKIPYMNKQVKASEIEDIITLRLKDTPKEDGQRNEQDIYVDEYLKFADAMFYLTGFTQLCVPAASRKSMTMAPGMKELRAKLLEENKDRLHDPATIAKIDAELVKFDKEYLKGDSASGFLISGKSYNIVRKKLFGMIGAETGFKEGQEIELVPSSLSEGWDIAHFPALNNSLRAGSYNRGAETMLGGESVKWLLRASSNITVTEDDCGSKLGMPFSITEKNYTALVGFYIIGNAGLIHIPDQAEAQKYIGKNVMVRSPMFCKLEKTDYCAKCVGDLLAANPTALSSAVAEYGNRFLYIYMKAMHGKALQLAKMDYKSAIT